MDTLQIIGLVIFSIVLFSKQSLLFSLPMLNGPSVMVSSADIKTLVGSQDSKLDVVSAHFDLLESDYMLLDAQIRESHFHEEVVRGPFSKRLGTSALLMWKEIQQSVDQVFGSQPGTLETLRVHDSICQVVARVASSQLVGEKLCHDERYLESIIGFSRAVAMGSFVIKLFPPFLRPLIGRVVSIPNHWYYRKIAPRVLRLISNKILLAQNGDMASKDPSDYLDYQIEHSLNSKDTIEQTPRQISLRLMVLNFATIFPASAMMTNVLLDLASQDRGASYIPSLREEIHRVGAIENQVWNERALDKLHRMDGVIKESFRMCGPLCYALPRKVQSPEGLRLENNSKLPRGTLVGVPMYSIHHDPSIYPSPHTYDASRFCPDTTDQDLNKGCQKPTSTNCDHYLVFGKGKHACPGRFFATNMIKLVLVYLLSNYEIGLVEERPTVISASSTQLLHPDKLPPQYPSQGYNAKQIATYNKTMLDITMALHIQACNKWAGSSSRCCSQV
ncbi:hypothetical protein P175DRAFT_0533961 [Aspergillus ochraceoroseus IBT 24754]|uniref:Cytochrome P450 n=1 Tax=Aspergillus ochraceoroseus IBT 24754 TaxID=1392256 RepID=A0A2T5LTB3_9EURO|nr:uncharacterized protein P175DRAFT_0533961 [Aspergillus ochraceoroseus IBT 24754]PTU19522.1 hypothetical protein P175DRAFT_0533961 [Aspergillus ochraceoroseus IBT 24754]